MSDLIDRQAAIDAIQAHKEEVLGQREWDEGIAYGYAAAHNHICDVISNLPSAQPERKKGKWYKPKEYPRDSYRYICSSCQDIAYYVTGNNGKKHKEEHPECGYRYCPNCGADMRKETEGGTTNRIRNQGIR